MTLYLAIGGTAEPDQTPCHSVEQWHALFDALARGDDEGAMRIALNERPTMLATASMRPLAAEDVGKHAGEFWRKYAERHGAAKPAKHGETSYSVAPNRADPKTNKVLRRVVEGPRK